MIGYKSVKAHVTKPNVFTSCFAKGEWRVEYEMGKETTPPIRGSLLFLSPGVEGAIYNGTRILQCEIPDDTIQKMIYPSTEVIDWASRWDPNHLCNYLGEEDAGNLPEHRALLLAKKCIPKRVLTFQEIEEMIKEATEYYPIITSYADRYKRHNQPIELLQPSPSPPQYRRWSR